MALEILGLLVAGAGAGWAWWQLRRRSYVRDGMKALASIFDDDAQVVIGVAGHAMTSRGHPEMWPLHVLYGLLQNETFTATLKSLDGDPDLAETQVLAALDERKVEPSGGAQLVGMLNRSYAISQIHERKAGIAELAVTLLGTDAASFLAVDTFELRFLLVHGMRPPPPELPGRTDVAVVIRNDDHTTFELVIAILVDVFGLSPDDAEARARETHHQGKTVVGRYKAAVAKDKVITARARAREQHAPLWIGLEDI